MTGSIEVIAGGMFSGKTEELLRRVRRECLARRPVVLFKHKMDDRYRATEVATHDALTLPCVPIRSSAELATLVPARACVVGVDEAQFFDEGIVGVVSRLADDGRRIILAGLDMDFQRRPFGPMSALMAIADGVTKIHAVCVTCGGPANYSYRTHGGRETVQVGAADAYEARCRSCYHVGERVCAVPTSETTAASLLIS